MSETPNTTKNKSIKTLMLATTALVAVPLAAADHAKADSFTVVAPFTNLLEENLGNGEDGYIASGATQDGDVTISGNTDVTLTNEGVVTGSITVDNVGDGSSGVQIVNATSATMSAAQVIRVTSGSDISGGIDNEGAIIGTAQGILVDGAGDISGGVTNNTSATISGFYGIAVISGGDISGGVTNYGDINTGSGTVYNGIYVDEASISGGIENYGEIGGLVGIYMDGSTSSISNGIMNDGTINASLYGISIEDGTVDGGINNTGNIESGVGINVLSGAEIIAPTTGVLGGVAISNGPSASISASDTGILVDGGTLTGDISNSGYIYGDDYAIVIDSEAGVTGDIVNNTSATISGYSGGILIESSSSVSGTISNSGLISADSEGAAIALVGDAYVGAITNEAGGMIMGATSGPFAGGITALFGSDIDGTITNAGDIYGLVGIGAAFGSDIGGIDNQAGGEIYGEQAGIAVTAGSSVGETDGEGVPIGDAITNAAGASIGVGSPAPSVTMTADVGIDVDGGTINGNIVNAGDIIGTSIGISIDSEGAVNGDINNSGLISGFDTGIRVVSSSTIDGDIINSGTISASHITGTAIYVDSSSDITGTIVNSGTIDGEGNAIYIAGGNSGSDVGVTNQTGGVIDGSVTMGSGDFRAEGGTVIGNVTGHTDGEFVFADGSASGSTGATGDVEGFGTIGIDNDTTVINNSGGLVLGGIANGQINIYDGALVNQTGPALNLNIVVTSSATNATITNAGVISVSGTDAIFVEGDLSGGLTNTGVISATATAFNKAIVVESDGDISGGIDNSGTIFGYKGIDVEYSGSISGGIINRTNGVINAVETAIEIGESATLSGGITNMGVIGASTAVSPTDIANHAIYLESSSVLNGGITNSGLIIANESALDLETATINGGITNSGQIVSLNDNAIDMYETTVDFITNAEGGVIAGGSSSDDAAIEMTDSTITGALTNDGTISGYAGVKVHNGSSLAVLLIT